MTWNCIRAAQNQILLHAAQNRFLLRHLRVNLMTWTCIRAAQKQILILICLQKVFGMSVTVHVVQMDFTKIFFLRCAKTILSHEVDPEEAQQETILRCAKQNLILRCTNTIPSHEVDPYVAQQETILH